MPSSTFDSKYVVRQDVPNEGSWTPLGLIGFRLLFTIGGSVLVLFVYGNFVVLSALIMPIRAGFAQVGSVLMRGHGVAMDATNSGDALGDWCALVGCVVVAMAAAGVWTVLDDKRDNYRGLGRALFELARIGLAVELLAYGLAKVIPVQMGYMTQPAHQLNLVGDLGLKDTLWTFMGVSDIYSIASGLAEFTAGILLLWRRTWLAGGFLAMLAMAQVFLLNLCYDVPVKLLSGTLLATAIAITLPYWSNVLQVLVNRAPFPPRQLWPAPGRGSFRRLASYLGFFAVVAHSALLGVLAAIGVIDMHSPQSALDGEWQARSFTVDGAAATMTEQDPKPWANVAITDRPDNTTFVSQVPSGATTVWTLDRQEGKLLIRERLSDAPTEIRYRWDANETLILSGVLGKHQIEGRYQRREMERSESGFRLVQPVRDPDLPSNS